MKREPRTIKELKKESIVFYEFKTESGHNRQQIRFDEEQFIKLIGEEVLNLANRHGNIKPREVMKYFGIEDEKISNNP